MGQFDKPWEAMTEIEQVQFLLDHRCSPEEVALATGLPVGQVERYAEIYAPPSMLSQERRRNFTVKFDR